MPKTAASVMLRGSVSRRFAAPAVTKMYSGSGGCTGCTSAEEFLDGTALSPGHASGPLSTSISTSLANGFGGCIGCTSSEEQETLPEGAAKSQRHAVNRLLSTPTATSLYSSSSVSDCTGCTSSDEAGQESSSGVATVSVSPTVAPTRGTLVSAFTSSSATATLISGGSDDSDDGQGYGDEDDSSSAIEVMTPANGEVICPDDEIEVRVLCNGLCCAHGVSDVSSGHPQHRGTTTVDHIVRGRRYTYIYNVAHFQPPRTR